MSVRENPSSLRRIDYTTRHRRWEFEHRWGPQFGDTRKYGISLREGGKGIDVTGFQDGSHYLPLPVAQAFLEALTEALEAAADQQH